MDGGALHEVVLQILQTDLQVQLTAAGNDVFAGLSHLAADHGVALTELLQTLHQLGQIGAVLDTDGHTHDRHGELHGLDAARGLAGGDGA